MDPQTAELIETTLRHMSRSYYAWYFIYIVLGVVGVMLPGLAALGVGGPDVSRRLAAAAALVAATFAFVKPHEYATGFDAAKQITWQTQIAYSLGTIDTAEVSRRLEQAVEVTTFRYGGRALTGEPGEAPAGAAL
jgi:hypothetical protein